ncbi:MAG: polysaccharide biosynthesis protein [Phototrophicales bacterium]|nr:MAG: polysaccharide biosynthesis protein [Phototrophicales bacterium]RMG73461.1 MAG: NAD-dependent epimerase/dehydratase family protein [Chloroflexota bacterium]
MTLPLEGKRILITGGTGSFGQVVVKRLLSGEMGQPENITVFSRDEAKQHYMRLSYINREAATDEIIFENFKRLLRFRIGDIRDPLSVLSAVREADVVIHAAALKQVPTCEYFPGQAVQTNIMGAQNIVNATRSNETNVETVVALSTDKACKPINVMGMTKAIMERIIVEGNMWNDTRLVAVRYGNVIASRGSVVPLFLGQIKNGGPVTITDVNMTRFLLSLNKAVDTVFAAIKGAQPGELYIPQVPAAKITDLAAALIGDQEIEIKVTGIRPGEKIHEILVSEEEAHQTIERDGYYVIRPMLPELQNEPLGEPALTGEYSSSNTTLGVTELRDLLQEYIEEHRMGEKA